MLLSPISAQLVQRPWKVPATPRVSICHLFTLQKSLTQWLQSQQSGSTPASSYNVLHLSVCPAPYCPLCTPPPAVRLPSSSSKESQKKYFLLHTVPSTGLSRELCFPGHKMSPVSSIFGARLLRKKKVISCRHFHQQIARVSTLGIFL